MHQTTPPPRPYRACRRYGSLLALILPLLSGALNQTVHAQAATDSKEANSEGRVRLTLDATLGEGGSRVKPLYATTLEHRIQVSRGVLKHQVRSTFTLMSRSAESPVTNSSVELQLLLRGNGEVQHVTGEGLLDWSVRLDASGARSLVLRTKPSEQVPTPIVVNLTAQTRVDEVTSPTPSLTFSSPQAELMSGFLRIDADAGLDVRTGGISGLFPIEAQLLPPALKPENPSSSAPPLAFRFHGSAYSLPLLVGLADPETRTIVLSDFALRGQLEERKATFQLTAIARVKNPDGASLRLLSGRVGLVDATLPPHVTVQFIDGSFVLKISQPGDYPISIPFHAAVTEVDGIKRVDFQVAPSVLQPITLEGLKPDTQIEVAGGTRPQARGGAFTGFLPSNGSVAIVWKDAGLQSEAKLFYSAEMLSQITVGSGLMRQSASLEFKVMQGELSQVALDLKGTGSVTRVLGPSVLSWKVEPASRPGEQVLRVQFNQPQKDRFSLLIQTQSELAAFPQTFAALQIRPQGTTRFGGHLRVVNEGAVRLEVLDTVGLSQMAPEQFPTSELAQTVLAPTGNLRFVFRFSTPDYGLSIQADNVLPEVSVSQLLTYHLGETEQSIEAEMELDIREAPLRELNLSVPRGYAIAEIQLANLADYFLTDEGGSSEPNLRLVFGQPLLDRQLLRLRLDRNKSLGETNWTLPRVEVVKARATRGHVGVTADPGFRLSLERSQGLVEIATAYFPRKTPNLQAAFRLNEASWLAVHKVERLPQSLQADVFHLFSIGEGVGYGSSTISYTISGAPVSILNLELSSEYFNVEFTGRDIRDWQKTTNGYTVQLHTPVSGTYTLLATYERPFKPQGDILTFTGARPLDPQSEQGHTVIISANQFQVQPAKVSSGLILLEPTEVPPEYRLLFDAPILAAYRYNSRPFDLQLALTRLDQVSTLNLVIDRAAMTTRISKDGEVITDLRYFVKNRGNPHLRFRLAPGTELWSASVNGVPAAAVKDDQDHLIPLAHRADPNAVEEVELKIASRSASARKIGVILPSVQAPLLLAEWTLVPDAGQQLLYRSGSLTPASTAIGSSGWAQWKQLAHGAPGFVLYLAGVLISSALSLGIWRYASSPMAARWGLRHAFGGFLALCSFGLALFQLVALIQIAQQHPAVPQSGIHFVAPVQNAGDALSVAVINQTQEVTLLRILAWSWPALLGVTILLWSWITGKRSGAALAGFWTLLACSALQSTNGVSLFLGVILVFLLLHLLRPALTQWWRSGSAVDPNSASTRGASLACALILASWGMSGTVNTSHALEPKTEVHRTASIGSQPTLPDKVSTTLRVEQRFITGKTELRWTAQKDQLLPLLFEPAVLTAITYPTNSLKLVLGFADGKRANQLLALKPGSYDITVEYQLTPDTQGTRSLIHLPTAQGLVNQVDLTLLQRDVEVQSENAVSITRTFKDGNTQAKLILPPTPLPMIAWLPRSRDLQSEESIFYAEWQQLYAPVAGVIEGSHLVRLRPAQGQLKELVFTVPVGTTITDVSNPAPVTGTEEKRPAPAAPTPDLLAPLWRFDPDTRQLRVTINPAQSKPFALLIRSQVSAGPLPYDQNVGLLSIEKAAGQVGVLGLATGNEVQLDGVEAKAMASVNLEDFGISMFPSLASRINGLTLRRAYRYTETTQTASLKVSAVKPDIRIETQQTLSLGDDRILLAANLNVTITRAGIFKLSFLLPEGLNVETISGAPFSHWTEAPTPEGRVITMHLLGKTEGQHALALSLSGPGVKLLQGWSVPNLQIREAAKQSGQLSLVAEHGIRVQVEDRDGVTQLDPQKSGIHTPGVIAFRLLQPDWRLSLNLELVTAWVQVTGLQHGAVSEAALKVTGNFQYQIENAGLKSLRVQLPTAIESVRFSGDQVADFLPIAGEIANGLQTWEVKLHRRILGKYLLQFNYQTPLPEQATRATLIGAIAVDANLQRGFVTLESSGRVELRVPEAPAALLPAEPQSIPRIQRQDIASPSAHYTFRVIEPRFQLPMELERHAVAKLLPARVESLDLTTTVSDEGSTLTHLKLHLAPGDKRLLEMELPANSRFWFAFVNQNGVWPWKQDDRMLIPLEAPSRLGEPMVVEVYYSQMNPAASTRQLKMALMGPKMDLPLENITWRVFLNEKWSLTDWDGSLQFEEEHQIHASTRPNLETYLMNEVSSKSEKIKAAEGMINMANDLLLKGDPQEARRAFQNAYGLSTHDEAFNEDARVQLHNLKLQQALVGLNVRQQSQAGEYSSNAAQVRQLKAKKELNYTQQDAKQLLDANTAGDSAALRKLAERIIQQQEAAAINPTAIRATLPEQSKLFTFKRAVQVQAASDLHLSIEARSTRTSGVGFQAILLLSCFLGALLILKLIRTPPRAPRPPEDLQRKP